MPYNDLISRADAAGEIPESFTQAIIGDIEQMSTVMRLGRSVPVGTKDTRVPVLSTTPDAFFVGGDSALKQTSSAEFESTPMIVEEIADLIVIPDAVVDDSSFQLWDAIRPLVARAFARKIDAAIVFGQGKPSTWEAGLVPQAIAAGNVVNAGEDPVVDLLSAAQIVSEQGQNPTAACCSNGWQYKAAATRSDAFTGSPVGANQPFPLVVAGLPLATDPVMWDPTAADLIVADWRNVLIGVRQQITVDFSNTATLVNESGVVTMSAFQQDSTVMRTVMRIGWMLAKPATVGSTRPVSVSVVVPSGGPSS